MAPIVVPGVARFSVIQSIGGQPVVNIIDMQVDTTGSPVSRSEALDIVAGDILNNWDDHILQAQRADISAQEVRYLDLNSLNGPTGSRSSTSANTWPKAGADSAGASMPAVVAMRVDKRTAGGRGTKQGRMYLAGIHEQGTDNGVTQTWNSSWITSFNAALASFLEGINDQDFGGVSTDIQRQMVVVHSTTQTYSEVLSLSVNPAVSTQVRRGTLR